MPITSEQMEKEKQNRRQRLLEFLKANADNWFELPVLADVAYGRTPELSKEPKIYATAQGELDEAKTILKQLEQEVLVDSTIDTGITYYRIHREEGKRVLQVRRFKQP